MEIAKKINMSNCFSAFKIEPDFSKYDHYVNTFHFTRPDFLLCETFKEGEEDWNIVQKWIVFQRWRKRNHWERTVVWKSQPSLRLLVSPVWLLHIKLLMYTVGNKQYCCILLSVIGPRNEEWSSLFQTTNKIEVLCSFCMKVVTVYLNKNVGYAFPNCMYCTNLLKLGHSQGKIWVGCLSLGSFKILLSARPQKTNVFSFK